MSPSEPRTIPDEIPSALSTDLETRIDKAFSTHIEAETFRRRVKEIFGECIETVDFMKKVKGYSKEQIESSVYQNLGFWIKTVVLPIVATVITYFILRSLNIPV